MKLLKEILICFIVIFSTNHPLLYTFSLDTIQDSNTDDNTSGDSNSSSNGTSTDAGAPSNNTYTINQTNNSIQELKDSHNIMTLSAENNLEHIEPEGLQGDIKYPKNITNTTSNDTQYNINIKEKEYELDKTNKIKTNKHDSQTIDIKNDNQEKDMMEEKPTIESEIITETKNIDQFSANNSDNKYDQFNNNYQNTLNTNIKEENEDNKIDADAIIDTKSKKNTIMSVLLNNEEDKDIDKKEQEDTKEETNIKYNKNGLSKLLLEDDREEAKANEEKMPKINEENEEKKTISGTQFNNLLKEQSEIKEEEKTTFLEKENEEKMPKINEENEENEVEKTHSIGIFADLMEEDKSNILNKEEKNINSSSEESVDKNTRSANTLVSEETEMEHNISKPAFHSGTEEIEQRAPESHTDKPFHKNLTEKEKKKIKILIKTNENIDKEIDNIHHKQKNLIERKDEIIQNHSLNNTHNNMLSHSMNNSNNHH